jgi:hypothetical protein
MSNVNSGDIKRAALIASGCMVAWWVGRRIERLGDRSDVPLAIFVGVFAGWMVYQITRNRKRPLDPLRVKYGRLTVYGIMTMLVVRVVAARITSSDAAWAIAVAFLAVWFIVVDFLYRKGQEKK